MWAEYIQAKIQQSFASVGVYDEKKGRRNIVRKTKSSNFWRGTKEGGAKRYVTGDCWHHSLHQRGSDGPIFEARNSLEHLKTRRQYEFSSRLRRDSLRLYLYMEVRAYHCGVSWSIAYQLPEACIGSKSSPKNALPGP